eukprot:gene48816-56721_t
MRAVAAVCGAGVSDAKRDSAEFKEAVKAAVRREEAREDGAAAAAAKASDPGDDASIDVGELPS